MNGSSLSVGIVGGSGYVGGELLRLIDGHPHLQLSAVTSESLAGTFVHHRHPNLRSAPRVKFRRLAEMEPCDVIFSALPHGRSSEYAEWLTDLCKFFIDTGADHRLENDELRDDYYPELSSVKPFTYALPEINRAQLRTVTRAAGPGCTAATTILGLWPLARAGLLADTPVVVEAKVGSSAAGASPNPSTHHPERSGVMRSFAPAGHRHEAEVIEQLGLDRKNLHYSATAVEAVRGILVTAHCLLSDSPGQRELWSLYREAYDQEPFMRIVRERRGLYRYPEPRILSGTNYCEVGFEVDPHSQRVVVMSALDNLGKGAAGSALQSLNIMAGFAEDSGLRFLGLHP
ncbi:MAG: N-acetyl-gamma-glutamyl-phosphate reductase [Clostridia bacterium]